MSQSTILEQDISIEYLNNAHIEILNQIKDSEQSQTLFQLILEELLFFLTILINFIFLTIFITPILTVMTFFISFQNSRTLNDILLFIWIQICNISTLYSLVRIIYYVNEESLQKLIFLDGLCFFLSTTLVIAHIKSNIIGKKKGFLEIFADILTPQSFNTLIFTGEKRSDSIAYLFDTQICQGIWKEDSKWGKLEQYDYPIECRFKELGIQQITNKFAYFKLSKQPPMLQNKYSALIGEALFELHTPNFTCFFILIGVVAVKLFFSFLYLFLGNNTFSERKIIDISIIIFWCLSIVWNLNRVLGNYDLRRKTRTMEALNEFIDFNDGNSHKKKIDITCPISIETWDNARKFICKLDQNFLKYLEFAYFSLFFFYLIVILICVSAEGEFYWIIPKESILLEPLIVIMSFFNFILISCFLFFRIYEGQKYNDTFGTLEETVAYLLDVIEDIQSMYDFTFNYHEFQKEQIKYKKNKDESIAKFKAGQNSAYVIIIYRIKLLSRYYIENKTQYNNRIYKQDEKAILRKEIMNNMIYSLSNLKRSIINDSEQYSYKFLNRFQAQFSDTLFTLTLTIATLLPNIIPKMFEMYQNVKKE